MQFLNSIFVLISLFVSVTSVLLSSQKTYVCDNRKRVITCEQKKNATIKVLDAYYGRYPSLKCLETEHDYGKFKNSTCRTSYTKVFQKRCNGAKKCELDTKSLKAQCKSFVPKMLDIVFDCESHSVQEPRAKSGRQRTLKTLKRKRNSKSKRKLTAGQRKRLREHRNKMRRLRHQRRQLLKKRRFFSGKKIQSRRLIKVPNLSLDHKLLMNPKLIRHRLNARNQSRN